MTLGAVLFHHGQNVVLHSQTETILKILQIRSVRLAVFESERCFGTSYCSLEVLRSRTGTGKTLAYALPVLERLRAERWPRTWPVLILVPTRELCQQTAAVRCLGWR